MKAETPVCGECAYMHMTGRAEKTANNGGIPRGACHCQHPDAIKTFERTCPRSPRMPGFIAFTEMGGDKPKVKTSPRWCPLRQIQE